MTYYTTRCCECSLYDIENIFKKQYIFYFNLSIVSFHANLKFLMLRCLLIVIEYDSIKKIYNRIKILQTIEIFH